MAAKDAFDPVVLLTFGAIAFGLWVLYDQAQKTMANIEVGYLKKALKMTDGSYTKAAQLLKMSLRSFRYKIQKYKVEKD